MPSTTQRLKPHFWAGIALLLIGHVLIFARTPAGDFVRPYSDYWFAAVWFGYIFALDALVYRRDGKSLIVTHPRVFLSMLPLSAVMWWAFEWINEIVKNWHYLRPYDMPEWWAQAVSMLFFSTVIPAIWVTADWVLGWKWVSKLPRLRGFGMPGWLVWALVGLGLLFFLLPSLWPLYFFPLIWGFAALILDPLNYKLGRSSILNHWSRGDWRIPIAFYISGHICGILWEFWNYWAFPKWIYTVPYVGFLKIFEMPLLGYLGYGPFAWEVYAVFWFVAGLFRYRPPTGKENATATLAE